MACFFIKTEVLGIPVLDAQFLTTKNSEPDKDIKAVDKTRLVFTIDASISPEELQALKALLSKVPDNNEESKTDKKSRLVQEIHRQGAIERDLSRADLSDAKVENAQFESNFGITEPMKQNLIKRGAIFNDFPGDRSRSLVHN